MSSHLSRFYAGAVAAALLLGGSAAHAFTIENGGSAGGGNALAPSPFYDSTKKYDDKSSSNGRSTMQFGNTSIYMGPGDSQYMREQQFRDGMDRMFSPLGRPPN